MGNDYESINIYINLIARYKIKPDVNISLAYNALA